uniref:Uncharacterized protein n=1 Tax=Anguilla anguilla TaxID=7936 RepID=A0A0E9U6H3_ANGAN
MLFGENNYFNKCCSHFRNRFLCTPFSAVKPVLVTASRTWFGRHK